MNDKRAEVQMNRALVQLMPAIGYDNKLCGMCRNIQYMREAGENVQEYARRSMRIYRKLVLTKRGLVMRKEYIGAYLCAKRAVHQSK